MTFSATSRQNGQFAGGITAQKIACGLACCDQALNFLPQGSVVSTRPGQEFFTFLTRRYIQRADQDFLNQLDRLSV
jgi:hypothetical protein